MFMADRLFVHLRLDDTYDAARKHWKTPGIGCSRI
jgi:hypothetical protein